MIDDCLVEYSDLIERAAIGTGDLEWGRFQNVSRNYRFVDGALQPIA